MISLLLKHDYYSLVTDSICKIFFIFQPKLRLEQSKNSLAYNISSPQKSLMNEFENTHSTTLWNKNNVLINNTVYHYFYKVVECRFHVEKILSIYMFHNFHLNFVSLVPFLVYCILCNYPLTPADVFIDSTDRCK